MKSLYIHFPFCEKKCHYCDFYSLGREATKTGDDDLFIRAARKEAAASASLLDPEIETIFFGGGTPTLTPAEATARVLDPIFRNSRLASDYEWTIEANPSSISRQAIGDYRALGVNRVSVGVQSLDSKLLLDLGRVHSRESALGALETVFAAGIDNVSVDLLCGVPGQSLALLEASLEGLASFPISHLSCYLLTLPKGHLMYRDLPNEERQLEHLLFIDQWMRSRGFEHYEISNFAKPGRRAKHNLAYWKGASYLGLGPSAHSFDSVAGKRWKNISSLHRYAEFLLVDRDESAVEWSEVLTEEQRRLERWMLALRLDEGFPEDWLRTSVQQARARSLEERGLLEGHPGDASRKRLTAKGFALSDQIIAMLA